MEIIPAIDIIDGKCVRLMHGDFAQKKIYNERPLEVARQFEDAGLQRLHLVDLDGARTGSVKNWKVLELIAGKTKLQIDFGGGVHTEQDVQIVLESGSRLVTVGSVAVKNDQEFLHWLSSFGADKFFLGADVKQEKIVISGWVEETEISVFDFIKKFIALGLKQIFCTDVAMDGALKGPAVPLYKEIVARNAEVQLVASGGVSSLKDLDRLVTAGCSGAIIGKALYEQKIQLPDLIKWIENAGQENHSLS